MDTSCVLSHLCRGSVYRPLDGKIVECRQWCHLIALPLVLLQRYRTLLLNNEFIFLGLSGIAALQYRGSLFWLAWQGLLQQPISGEWRSGMESESSHLSFHTLSKELNQE